MQFAWMVSANVQMVMMVMVSSAQASVRPSRIKPMVYDFKFERNQRGYTALHDLGLKLP